MFPSESFSAVLSPPCVGKEVVFIAPQKGFIERAVRLGPAFQKLVLTGEGFLWGVKISGAIVVFSGAYPSIWALSQNARL